MADAILLQITTSTIFLPLQTVDDNRSSAVFSFPHLPLKTELSVFKMLKNAPILKSDFKGIRCVFCAAIMGNTSLCYAFHTGERTGNLPGFFQLSLKSKMESFSAMNSSTSLH